MINNSTVGIRFLTAAIAVGTGNGVVASGVVVSRQQGNWSFVEIAKSVVRCDLSIAIDRLVAARAVWSVVDSSWSRNQSEPSLSTHGDRDRRFNVLRWTCSTRSYTHGHIRAAFASHIITLIDFLGLASPGLRTFSPRYSTFTNTYPVSLTLNETNSLPPISMNHSNLKFPIEIVTSSTI